MKVAPAQLGRCMMLEYILRGGDCTDSSSPNAFLKCSYPSLGSSRHGSVKPFCKMASQKAEVLCICICLLEEDRDCSYVLKF